MSSKKLGIAFALLASSFFVNVQAEQQVFEFHQRVSGLVGNPVALAPAFSWSLKNEQFDAVIGSPFSLSLESLISTPDEIDDFSGFSWTVLSRPSWLSFNESIASISGTPSHGDFGSGSFEIIAAHGDDEESRTYTIKVDDVYLEVKKISTGNSSHTCAITTGNAAVCWGNNSNGQLGTGDTVSSSRPVQVLGLNSGVVDISAGRNSRSCAVLSDRTARCWGFNGNGQIGDGTTTRRLSPVTVSNLSNIVEINADGMTHTCARTSNNLTYCWGNNGSGQLGDGTTAQKTRPVLVSGLTGVNQISLGGYSTCARHSGVVSCWGNGSNGRLGNGSTVNRNTPVRVTGISSGATWISSGSEFSCAVVSGAARCWGAAASGQMGTGTLTDRLTPVTVSGFPSGVSMISSGNSHSCLRTTSSDAYCWGNGTYGQLGNEKSVNRSIPVGVLGLNSNVAEISAGGNSSCARLIGSNNMVCWGAGLSGQLGDGSTLPTNTPVTVRRGSQ